MGSCPALHADSHCCQMPAASCRLREPKPQPASRQLPSEEGTSPLVALLALLLLLLLLPSKCELIAAAMLLTVVAPAAGNKLCYRSHMARHESEQPPYCILQEASKQPVPVLLCSTSRKTVNNTAADRQMLPQHCHILADQS